MAGQYEPPVDAPFALASYVARSPIRAYIEPVAVGSRLADMPLFLTPDHYVTVLLEPTCQEAYAGLPARWRRVLEEEVR